MRKRIVGLMICLLITVPAANTFPIIGFAETLATDSPSAVPTGVREIRTVDLAQGTNARIVAELNEQIRLNPVFAAGESISYWKTTNAKTVSVDESGILLANREGTVTISMKTASGLRAKIDVKVVDPYKPEKIAFTQTGTLILNKDETLQLNAVMEPATARSELTYSTSNKKYATVDAKGVVTGHAEGTVSITVRTYNGRKATIKIKVVDPYKPEKIAFTQTGTLILNKDETLQLNAVMEPATARSELTYSTSNKRYATVDAQGIVTGHAEGTVSITVRTYNGRKATIKIKVVDPYKPERIAFAPNETMQVNLGETVQLHPVMEPATARSELTWSASSTKYATVDVWGNVTGLAVGTLKITVRTYNGKKATINVQVVDPYAPEKVVIEGPETITIETGTMLDLAAHMEPATAQSVLNWNTSNSRCLKVQNGGSYIMAGGTSTDQFLALKPGTVTVTVKASNGKKDTINVTVVDPPKINGDVRECLGMTITELNRHLDYPLQQSTQDNIYYNNYMIMITDPLGRVAAITMSTDVNKVSSRYNLFGVRLGSEKKYSESTLASNGWVEIMEESGERLYMTEENIDLSMITACDSSGKINYIFYGDIYAAGLGNQPSSIILSLNNVVMQVGEQLQLYVGITPETSYTKLFWTSANPNVVTVDEYGCVTAVAPGTTAVRVYTGNGLFEYCYVYVSDPTHYFGELTGFMGKNIKEASEKLAVKPEYTSMNDYYCYNYDVRFMTDDSGKIVVIMTDSMERKYTLGGVHKGVPKSEAVAMLNKNGWKMTGGAPNRDLYWGDWICVEEQVFASDEHPGRMYVRYDTFGDVVNVVYDGRP